MATKNRSESHWTLQQFTTKAGRPWYALQQHNDDGLLCQFTGYRHELEGIATKHGITPEELDPITKEEFFKRLNETVQAEWFEAED